MEICPIYAYQMALYVDTNKDVWLFANLVCHHQHLKPIKRSRIISGYEYTIQFVSGVFCPASNDDNHAVVTGPLVGSYILNHTLLSCASRTVTVIWSSMYRSLVGTHSGACSIFNFTVVPLRLLDPV